MEYTGTFTVYNDEILDMLSINLSMAVYWKHESGLRKSL